MAKRRPDTGIDGRLGSDFGKGVAEIVRGNLAMALVDGVRQPGQAVGLAKSGFRSPLYVELLSDDAALVRRSVAEIAAWSDLFVVD